MKALPPLNSLRAFESAARVGSFKDAADELCVTPAAVSYQIRSLESHLGIALFHRTHGGLELTDAGRRFLPTVQEVCERLATATNEITGASSNVLKVNVLPTFASSWLVPRIWKFHQAFPDIRLEIHAHSTLGYPVEFSRDGSDVAVRAGLSESDWPTLIAHKLVHEEMFPVCSPLLISSQRSIHVPEDLAKHTLIVCSSAPEGWNTWLHAAESRGYDISGINPSKGLSFDIIQMAMDACALGQGVVIGRRPLVDMYLDSGRLIAPFDFSVFSKLAYWLVAPKATAEKDSVVAFRSWILDELAQYKTGD